MLSDNKQSHIRITPTSEHQNSRKIVINGIASDKFLVNDFNYAELSYDIENNKIAIKLLKEKTNNSLKISTSCANFHAIAATCFCKFFSIPNCQLQGICKQEKESLIAELVEAVE